MTTKNFKKSLLKKQKKFQIDDIDVNKILVSKKEPDYTKNEIKTLSDIMIMTLLDQ